MHWGIDETCALVRRGEGYVAVEWGEYLLVSTYCSPNVNRERLEKLLGEIENDVISSRRKKIIIGGDLNAREKQ